MAVTLERSILLKIKKIVTVLFLSSLGANNASLPRLKQRSLTDDRNKRFVFDEGLLLAANME